MDNIKQILAKNITTLRQEHGMTQLMLAEKLNYSDKAISKWERAESIPDVTVLMSIANLFGVTVDYLLEEEHKPEPKQPSPTKAHKIITFMGILLVWLIAIFTFIVLNSSLDNHNYLWLTFIYALPCSSIVYLILNSIWLNKRHNYFIVSFLMWTAILAIYLTLLAFNLNIWLLFTLGVPGQLIIIMWSRIHTNKPQ